ncbi:MAG: ABC transporter substrate-binding protein [Actinobacteria bacterium]|nr:ABC transporter substrate-binding protein [Actinomycetota bacterium]
MLLAIALAVGVAACGGSGSSSDAAGGSTGGESTGSETVSSSEGGETQSVTLGVLPFLDYQPWYVAHELGLDKELGYDLQFKQFPLEPNEVQAMVRGEVQIGQGAIGSVIPLLPERPDLRVFLNLTQFKGFAFVVRKGAYENYEEFAKELGNEKAARTATMKQFEGQDVVTIESSFKATIAAALEEAGLTYSDIKVTNFSESAAAAIAFIRGEGDIFMGGLPETVKLVKEHPEEYEILIGAEHMGPPGLWFSNAFVTESYLKENREQLLALTAIWYRTMRYLKEDKAKTYPILAAELNKASSGELSTAEIENLVPDFTYFPTSEEAKEKIYTPSSPSYWKTGTEYLVASNEKQKTIEPGSVSVEEFVVQEELFNEFLKDKKLVDYVNAPLK